MHQCVTEHEKDLDLVWGYAGIGAALNLSERQARYLLTRNMLPAQKIGERWVASKSDLREYFNVRKDRG